MDSLFFTPASFGAFPAPTWFDGRDAGTPATLDTCEWGALIVPSDPIFALAAPDAVAPNAPLAALPGYASPPSSPDVADSTERGFSCASEEAFSAVASLYESGAARSAARRPVTKRLPKSKAGQHGSSSSDDEVSGRRPAAQRAARATASSSAGGAPNGKGKLAHLTEEERVVLRRLKNREASQLSRDRKRQRLEVLEVEVAHQKSIVETVTRERDSAVRMAAQLRAELAQIKAAYAGI